MAAAYACGIRVNALCPGSVDTDMTRSTGPESQAQMAAACLQRRIAHPDEIVGPALFLASAASSYVTGQVLLAHGGLVSHRAVPLQVHGRGLGLVMVLAFEAARAATINALGPAELSQCSSHDEVPR